MKFRIFLASVLLVLGVAAGASGMSDKELEKHPGYVDFEAMNIFGDQEAMIEVYLKEQMLDLVSKFVKNDDPELYEMLSKLRLVRVLVFEVDWDLANEFKARSSTTVKELDKKGWERIVRVKEDEGMVYVYVKPSEKYEYFNGLCVLVIDDEEAVFVNIVGEIHPDDIGRIGDHFDIDELNGHDYRSKKGR